MNRRARAFVALLVGCAATGGTYALFPNSLLAVTAGLCWITGVIFATRDSGVWRGDAVSAPNAGSALIGPLVIAVGIFGFNAGLPLSIGLRGALLVTIVGALFAAVGAGVRMARSAADGRAPPTDSGANADRTAD